MIDGTVVGRGRARHLARRTQLAHAELEALLDAGEAILERHDDAILVTTLEPCPLCLGAAVMADVPAIVFALEDALVQSTPIRERVDHVRRHIRTYEGGLRRAESRALFERYRPDVLPALDGRSA